MTPSARDGVEHCTASKFRVSILGVKGHSCSLKSRDTYFGIPVINQCCSSILCAPHSGEMSICPSAKPENSSCLYQLSIPIGR